MKTSEVLWTVGRAVSSLPRWLFICAIAAAALYARYFWPDPKNEHVAEGLVTSGYQTARSSASEEQYDHREWEQAERQYGRVVSWHITGRHRTLFRHQWAYDVDVMRERAATKERVEASAGPSNAYGYFTSIISVNVENAQPRSTP